MKWPFVKRKKYDAMTRAMAEEIARLEDEVRWHRHHDNGEIRALRQALEYKGRADAYEKHLLDMRAMTPIPPTLIAKDKS